MGVQSLEIVSKKECLNFGVIVLSLMLVSLVREVVCVQHRLSTKQCRDPSPGLGVHFGVYQCLTTYKVPH